MKAIIIRSFGLATSFAMASFAPTLFAQTTEPAVQVAFTDSTAAGLAPTKRVAITSVIVSFQASVGFKKDGGTGMFADKSTSTSLMTMPYMDPDLQDAITAQAYRHLKADLVAAGYEIVPEAEVAADASYKEIIGKVGFVNHSRSLNALGAAVLVSPPTLTPYMPYTMEGGGFQALAGGKGSFVGWPSSWGKVAAWGKSPTPGGYSLMTAATFYKLPGLEVALAKSLNAHVVKAFYVVNIGSTTAGHGRSWGLATSNFGATGTRTTFRGTASAFAQLGLLAEQTRIAFRSPTGNAKWQKVNLNKSVPAKDGDVVVHLAETMLGGTDYFDLAGDGGKMRGEGTFFESNSDFKFTYVASVTDSAAYGSEVQAMIASATHSMLALVKR